MSTTKPWASVFCFAGTRWDQQVDETSFFQRYFFFLYTLFRHKVEVKELTSTHRCVETVQALCFPRSCHLSIIKPYFEWRSEAKLRWTTIFLSPESSGFFIFYFSGWHTEYSVSHISYQILSLFALVPLRNWNTLIPLLFPLWSLTFSGCFACLRSPHI